MASEAFPVIRSGSRAKGSLIESMLPRIARKTTAQQVVSDSTVNDDEHISFSVEANAVYSMDGWLFYSANSTADIKFGFSVPANTLGEWSVLGPGSGSTTQTQAGHSIRTITRDPSDEQSLSGLGLGVANASSVIVQGMWRIGSVPGTLTLQWAQGTSDAGATVLYNDSWIRLQRIA